MTPFAEYLHFYRTERGLSQFTVAEGAGFDKSFISRLESDDRKPSRSVVLALAESMQLSPEDTDKLLLAAEFSPVQGQAMLNTPELATLDQLLDVAGGDDRIQALDMVWKAINLLKLRLGAATNVARA